MSMYLSSYAPNLRINETVAYPYERIANKVFNISSLTRNLSTITAITTTKHGYSNSNSVIISGASQSEYNGTYQIAVIDDYTFTYTITGTPISPATGTIFVTLAPQLPISIELLKTHVRIDDPNAQTDYLTLLIEHAARVAEDFCNVSFIYQGWRTYRNNFNQISIELRKGYFVSLDAFKYLVNNSYIDVNSDLYYVSKEAGYSQIRLNSGQEFPNDIDLKNNSVLIDFTSGIAPDASTIPSDLKLALLNHIAFAYENRGNNDIAGMASSGTGDMAGLNAIPNISMDVYAKYRITDITSGYTYNIY